jgi:hypothetical protein
MNPTPLKDPPFIHNAEEGTLFSPIRPLRFREGKGAERVIARPRLPFVCVAGLEPRCILLIGRLRVSHPGCKPSCTLDGHTQPSSSRISLFMPFVLSSRQDAGRQAHHLLPGEMTVATPGFLLGSPSPSQVWAFSYARLLRHLRHRVSLGYAAPSLAGAFLPLSWKGVLRLRVKTVALPV